METLADKESPVLCMVQTQIEEELSERKLTMIAERHLERELGPDLVAYQAMVARKEALGFGTAIKDITAAHIEKVVSQLMAKNFDAVATALVMEKVDSRMAGWQPDESKVDAAVEQSPTACMEDAVGRAVECSLCDTRNVLSLL